MYMYRVISGTDSSVENSVNIGTGVETPDHGGPLPWVGGIDIPTYLYDSHVFILSIYVYSYMCIYVYVYT
jgi:hypothetical protein